MSKPINQYRLIPSIPDDIQTRALETWHVHLDRELQREHAIYGLVGESGEYANLRKKHLFKPGHESTKEQRLDELGDVLYYLAILALLDGCSIDELSRRNHEKLTKNGDNHGWLPDYYLHDDENKV
jgi:NTP pyrophosphatase (non-canonical NTP hydrolase)